MQQYKLSPPGLRGHTAAGPSQATHLVLGAMSPPLTRTMIRPSTMEPTASPATPGPILARLQGMARQPASVVLGWMRRSGHKRHTPAHWVGPARENGSVTFRSLTC
jgi:hypothetical protein